MLVLSSADFFSKLTFEINYSRNITRVSNGLDPDHDRRSVLSVLIWVQTFCKGYQQMTKVAASKKIVSSAFLFPVERLPIIVICALSMKL